MNKQYRFTQTQVKSEKVNLESVKLIFIKRKIALNFTSCNIDGVYG